LDPVERTDDSLREWADEHLLYEARMLVRAAELIQTGNWTNIEVESFAVHARCLTEFLWWKPIAKYPDDARAIHFCERGAWAARRGPIRPLSRPLPLRRRGTSCI
jgi:hypothetical protein